MPPITRRSLAAVLASSTSASAQSRPGSLDGPFETEVSLDGIWEFRTARDSKWRDVTVPHTWQIEPDNAGYMGAAVYRRRFDAPERWRGKTVRIQFEAVFHTAVVEVNGKGRGSIAERATPLHASTSRRCCGWARQTKSSSEWTTHSMTGCCREGSRTTGRPMEGSTGPCGC